MDELIERFTDQVREGLNISENANIHPHHETIHKVYTAGLGGSGIGADFVSSFIAAECSVPYLVGKSYDIPAYVDKHTVAIASSYSGNTEETLNALQQMENTGAKIVVVSSGGKMIEHALSKGYDHIRVPGNWPSPRACLGYSVVAQIFVMQKLNLISDRAVREMEAAIALIDKEAGDIRSKAQHIANFLNGRIPVFYTEDRMEPVALRWRQQVNENAKSLCWHKVIPEMNHNELVGWREKYPGLAVVFLRNRDDFHRNAVRMDITREIISEYCDTVMEIWSKGETMIQRAFYLIHLGDWVSWHLSQLRGMDSNEVRVIDFLKSELAKLDQ